MLYPYQAMYTPTHSFYVLYDISWCMQVPCPLPSPALYPSTHSFYLLMLYPGVCRCCILCQAQSCTQAPAHSMESGSYLWQLQSSCGQQSEQPHSPGRQGHGLCAPLIWVISWDMDSVPLWNDWFSTTWTLCSSDMTDVSGNMCRTCNKILVSGNSWTERCSFRSCHFDLLRWLLKAC